MPIAIILLVQTLKNVPRKLKYGPCVTESLLIGRLSAVKQRENISHLVNVNGDSSMLFELMNEVVI